MSEEILPKNREEWLTRELNKEMARFDDSATRNRIYARNYMVWGTVCSTLTTILLGWQGVSDTYTPHVKNTALILSAGVTILSAFNAFYNHRQLWLRYTVTWAQLRSIEKDLPFLLVGSPSDKDQRLDELHKRFRAILDETDASWLELRKNHASKAA